jgi:outer membrane protein insertion porin family/translocation and assembly module TamA
MLTGTLGLDESVSFVNERAALQPQVRRRLNPNSSVYAGYSAEFDRIVSIDDVLPEDALSSEKGKRYFISSLAAGYNYMFVDKPSYPSHGFSASALAEPASFLLGSQVDYFKAVLEAHLYGLIVKDWIIALRGKYGFIKPYRLTRAVPIFKRFFCGGSYSVRGYGYQQVGPRDPAGNPVGGEYLAEGSAELRCPVFGKVKGVLFLDGGYAYRSYFSFHDMSYGVGAGIRYVTPVGPLGVDLAFPVENFKSVDYGNYSLYITIGQTL